jgi:hypothetical protein
MNFDVANGVQGTIEGIMLDECEWQIFTKDSQTIHLHYPPWYVLVKLLWTKAPQLEGLPPNVIPIASITKTFITTKNREKMTVHRTQLPLTLAYAFTDYRLQGQTLQPIYVDIASPPYGRLTPFNIYVALSRGTGQHNIQLLQDFDETLLQHHFCEHLRLEDQCLQALNKTTKKEWESRLSRYQKHMYVCLCHFIENHDNHLFWLWQTTLKKFWAMHVDSRLKLLSIEGFDTTTYEIFHNMFYTKVNAMQSIYNMFLKMIYIFVKGVCEKKKPT